MTFSPLLPGWAVALAALAGAAALVAAYRRGGPAAVLRASALAVLVVMLLNPVNVDEQPARRRASVAIVVDSSLSMATDDCRDAGQPSRYALATAAATDLRDRLAATHDVEIFGLAGSALLPTPPKAPGGDTDFTPLEELLTATQRPEAVVLLSDGADWSDSRPEEAFIRAKVPLHTLAVGSARPASNAAVRLAATSATAFPGQELGLAAEVIASADLRGRTVRLTVEAIDDAGNAALLHERAIELAAWTRIEISAPVGDHRGGRLWRARIDQLPGEITHADNESWASAQVVDREVRVAVIEGEPGWDTTFAVRAWRRDHQFKVATVIGLGKRAWRAGGESPLPLNAKNLAGIDVLVLGSKVVKLLSAGEAEALAGFVDHGGGLLLFGPGPRELPAIDALDPCSWSPGLVQAELSSDGQVPGLMPAGTKVAVSAGAISALKPQTRVIAGTREQPLVALRHAGAGWVCSANLLGVWRWQLAAGAGGSEPAERFWRQLLHHLTNAPLGGLRPERTATSVGEDLTVWVQPDLGAVAVTVIDPEGRRSELRPDHDRVQLRIDHAGRWSFQLGTDRVFVTATQVMREALEISRDDTRLRRLAERTGGTWGEAGDAARVATRLAAAEHLAGNVRSTTPLITDPWWFVTAGLLLCGEWWWRRRRMGMV